LTASWSVTLHKPSKPDGYALILDDAEIRGYRTAPQDLAKQSSNVGTQRV